jgi:hypothetical protein
VGGVEGQAAEHGAIKLEGALWFRRNVGGKEMKPGFAQFGSIHLTRELTLSNSEHNQDQTSIDFDKTEALANIQTYHPHATKETIKIIEHTLNFNHEDVQTEQCHTSPIFLQVSFLTTVLPPLGEHYVINIKTSVRRQNLL